MKTVLGYEIIEVTHAREKNRIVFLFKIDDGTTIGPVVSYRDVNENYDNFIQNMIPSIEKDINKIPVSAEESLLRQVVSYPKDVIKTTLKIDDIKLAEINYSTLAQTIEVSIGDK